MAAQQAISERRLAAKIGRTLDVLIDAIGEEGPVGRSTGDAPEIDGIVFVDGEDLAPGDIVPVLIEDSDPYDLWGRPTAKH
jgi:ribosomal protein S12 methylthiotransferase